MEDIDIIKIGTSEKDIDLFLGPIEEGQDQIFFEEKDNWILAHVMFKCGVFPSISQARKNNWNKPIPIGYSQFIVGKLKTKITILNLKG